MASAAVATPSNSKVQFVPKRGKEYKPIKASVKYSADVKISAVTNRPIKDGEVAPKIDVYWCEPCKIKLTNPIVVLAHFTSHQHWEAANSTKKRKKLQQTKTNQDMKRKQTRDAAVARPAAKVVKSSYTPRGRGGARPSNYFNNSRQGFNLARDTDFSYSSYPQSYARGNDSFNQRPFGNNLMMQQPQQQLDSGLFSNMNQQQGSFSNLELLQARLLRNNQSGFGNLQGQSRGSFWR